MKRFLFALVFLLMTSNLLYSQDHRKLCDDDSLDVRESYGRIAWSALCAEKDVSAWFDRYAGDNKLSVQEKIEFFVRYSLMFADMKRTKPLYPIFSDGKKRGWIAPTRTPYEMEYPECIGVPGGMSIYTTCLSDRHNAVPHRVSRKELVRPITDYEREEIRRILAGQFSETSANSDEHGKETKR